MTLETILSRVHPEDRSSFSEKVQKGIRNASDYEDYYRIIREDGTIRHIHVLAHPVKNAAGNLGQARCSSAHSSTRGTRADPLSVGYVQDGKVFSLISSLPSSLSAHDVPCLFE